MHARTHTHTHHNFHCIMHQKLHFCRSADVLLLAQMVW